MLHEIMMGSRRVKHRGSTVWKNAENGGFGMFEKSQNFSV
jgi:hypothetical protein